MIDVKKLKYDLAVQSALATTILHRDNSDSVSVQIFKEFSKAYREYSQMSPGEFTKIQNSVAESEQLNFELINSLTHLNS